MEWRMDRNVTHVYCKQLTRGMEMDRNVTHVYCNKLTRGMENG